MAADGYVLLTALVESPAPKATSLLGVGCRAKVAFDTVAAQDRSLAGGTVS